MSPNTDRIAICGEIIPTSLKHRLLFFDRIGFVDLENVYKLLAARSELAAEANDLEFLQSKNIVFAAKGVREIMTTGWPLIKRASSESIDLWVKNAQSDFLSFMQANIQFDEMAAGVSQAIGSTFARLWNLRVSQMQFHARLCALYLQCAEGLTASAVFSQPLIIAEGVQHFETADVIDVVLDKLPMPSELTPWEAILDFKADTEAQGYLQGLKVWMADIARQKLTPTEANEKLEWLIFQHKKHLEMHKLSYRWGTLGGTFVAAAEIAEDLVKIKWGKAAGAIVSIVDKRLELLKAELSNPAKEISYIVKAQEKFGE